MSYEKGSLVEFANPFFNAFVTEKHEKLFNQFAREVSKEIIERSKTSEELKSLADYKIKVFARVVFEEKEK